MNFAHSCYGRDSLSVLYQNSGKKSGRIQSKFYDFGGPFLCPANSSRVFLKGSKHNFVDKIAIWCSQGVFLPIINLAKPGGRESEFSKS